jgi:hypothetical protein
MGDEMIGVKISLISMCVLLSGCEKTDQLNEDMSNFDSSELIQVQMSPVPPQPLEQLERKINALCGLNLKDWRRVYSYKWNPDERAFSLSYISFAFDKGPYEDLRPDRVWRDIRDAIIIDDRPNILSVYGHYNPESNHIEIVSGSCPN